MPLQENDGASSYRLVRDSRLPKIPDGDADVDEYVCVCVCVCVCAFLERVISNIALCALAHRYIFSDVTCSVASCGLTELHSLVSHPRR